MNPTYEVINYPDGQISVKLDSVDPVDIICGFTGGKWDQSKPETKGVIELLWDIFGGTINERGYKVLDVHIGAIYGDSITLDRARAICGRLEAKGFASTNIVLGIGSFTYQYNTRDTLGFAVKSTYGEITHAPRDQAHGGIETREIWKDPITDDGTKKSAKGLLMVEHTFDDVNGPSFKLVDQATPTMESKGALEPVFSNGILVRTTTLQAIRDRLKESLKYELIETHAVQKS